MAAFLLKVLMDRRQLRAQLAQKKQSSHDAPKVQLVEMAVQILDWPRAQTEKQTVGQLRLYLKELWLEASEQAAAGPIG